MQRANEDSFTKLLVVCAPAGYGKTTFLAEFARRQQMKDWAVAWFSIDAEDDGGSAFGAYLFQGILQALGPLSALTQASQIFRVSADVDLAATIPALINAVAACGRRLLIVLDDYQFIHADDVHDALVMLIEHLPENVRLAVGSRTEPPFPLSRLRARGKLLDLGAVDLGFSQEEAAKFLKGLMKLELSGEQIQRMNERAEGWAAGLQLAALSMARSGSTEDNFASLSGGQKILSEYLLAEVFEGLSVEKQEFLIRSSILERFCASECAALMGRGFDSESLLLELERENLFVVALDEKSCWFRYHHLFLDFLRARSNRLGGEKIGEWHRIASGWLEENGYFREAAAHAFASADWDFSADFVERNCFPMIIHSQIAALTDWCSRFPEDVMHRRPLLCVYQCWAWVFRCQKKNNGRIESRLRLARELAQNTRNERLIDEISENEKVIRQMMAMAPDAQSDPGKALREAETLLLSYTEMDAAQFSCLLNIAYARMAMLEMKEAGKELEKARDIAVNAHLLFGIVESSFELATLAYSEGKFGSAMEVCRSARNEIKRLAADPETVLPGIGCLDIVEGRVLIEQGNLEAAETCLQRGLSLVGSGTNQHYLMTGNIALYHLLRLLRRPVEAETCLANLTSMWPDVAFLCEGLDILARLEVDAENRLVRRQALAWCGDLSSETGESLRMPGLGPFGASEVFYEARLAWMKIKIIVGVVEGVLPLLTAYQNQAEAKKLRLRSTQFEEIAQMREANADYKAKGIKSELVSPLSEREKEVLRLMAEGASNGEIADQFVVSVGTVKSHVNHILAKLDVKNRTQAVARAREFGLLDR